MVQKPMASNRIQETPNLSTYADRSPNTKIELFWGGRRTYGHTEVWTNGRTYGQRGGHILHVKISPGACQCSAM